MKEAPLYITAAALFLVAVGLLDGAGESRPAGWLILLIVALWLAGIMLFIAALSAARRREAREDARAAAEVSYDAAERRTERTHRQRIIAGCECSDCNRL